MSEIADTMIEAKGLVKHYGMRRAVDELSLTVCAGEIYGFLGPNGAGKTTTILMLLGIVDPEAGSAIINGHVAGRSRLDARRQVGGVSETQYLYADMSVFEYLIFFARLYQVEKPDQRVNSLLEEVRLSDRRNDQASDLSRGLQQKLGLARALLHDPPVLILDEPVSGLDPHGIREVRDLIIAQRDRGRCVFVSSHVLSEVEKTADRVGIIDSGRMVIEARPREIVARLSRDAEIEIEIDRPGLPLVNSVRGIPGVRSVSADGDTLTVQLEAGEEARLRVSRAVTSLGAAITGLRQSQMSLEEAFIQLTHESVSKLKEGRL